MTRTAIQWTGLVAGPIGAGLTYVLLGDPGQTPDGLSQETAAATTTALTPAGRATLAAMVWMAIWWLSEAVEISTTALLPIALFPLLGISTIEQATAPYASSLIFLFFGGFVLALSMQRWGLDRRIATLAIRMVGARPPTIVGAFMIVTATLSAFVSNTATAALMLPIATSVLGVVPERDADLRARMGPCLMLGIAYGASIGGLATIIGSPPNGILVEFLATQIAPEYRREIGFAEWLVIGLPLSATFLPLTWLLLTRFLHRLPTAPIAGVENLMRETLESLGPVRAGEWVTLAVFLLTATAWITRPWLESLGLTRLSDPGIAMAAALALFVIPVDARRRVFAMDWATMKKLPWEVLVLFGGGLSLAAAVAANGVGPFIAAQAAAIGTLPSVLVVLIVASVVIFLTELTSNTATTATFVPILAATAIGLGLHPYLLVFPAAIGASCAFMMPVATPPNAIVFGSGQVTLPQMSHAGIWLNAIAIVAVTGLTYAVIAPFLVR